LIVHPHFIEQLATQLVFSGSFARFVQSPFYKIRSDSERRVDYLLVGDNTYKSLLTSIPRSQGLGSERDDSALPFNSILIYVITLFMTTIEHHIMYTVNLFPSVFHGYKYRKNGR
jgi:hypothetical protein